MRTDMKIGIGVGLCVAAVILVWYIVDQRGQDTKPADDQQSKKLSEDDNRYNVLQRQPPSSRSPLGGTDRVIPILREPDEEIRPEEEKPAETPTTSSVRPPETVAETPGDVLPPFEPSPETTPPGKVHPFVRTDPATGQDIYVVRKGDAGFWGIAEKVYPHGKYWTRIADANPKADSRNLRPGQKLIIPRLKLPTTTPAAPAPTAALRPGETWYVVQADDTAGFWGIAKKVYGGQGKYFTLIVKRNPNVDPQKLHKGQKLIIPALGDALRPAEKPARKPEPQPETPPPPAGDGERVFD